MKSLNKSSPSPLISIFYISLCTSYNLGQLKWKIKTTLIPTSMMDKWPIFVLARVHHWLKGRGGFISYFYSVHGCSFTTTFLANQISINWEQNNYNQTQMEPREGSSKHLSVNTTVKDRNKQHITSQDLWPRPGPNPGRLHMLACDCSFSWHQASRKLWISNECVNLH